MTTQPTALAVNVAAELAAAEASAVVIWRGQRLPYATLPSHIAGLSDRGERNALWLSYLEAEEALNPLRERRMTALAPALEGEPLRAADKLAGEMRAFLAESETVYFAALRRHLALVDIEQGDATLADLWHIRSGAGWNHWWEPRRLSGAVGALGIASSSGQSGARFGDWRAGGDALEAAGRDALDAGADPELAGAVGEAFRTLMTDPGWLVGALRMDEGDVPPFTDYAAFWRTWELRNGAALLLYESQLYRSRDRGVQRAYYSGIVSLLTGVQVPEERYLSDVGEPLGSVRAVRGQLLGGMLVDQLRLRHGPGWWAEPALGETLRGIARAPGADAVARLGYDRLDWRPVLRQIRTQLIGEMSGYGGPNITTRAGTRKV